MAGGTRCGLVAVHPHVCTCVSLVWSGRRTEGPGQPHPEVRAGGPVCMDVVCEGTANPAPVQAEPNREAATQLRIGGVVPRPMKELGAPRARRGLCSAGAGCCAAGPQSAKAGVGRGLGRGRCPVAILHTPCLFPSS